MLFWNHPSFCLSLFPGVNNGVARSLRLACPIDFPNLFFFIDQFRKMNGTAEESPWRGFAGMMMLVVDPLSSVYLS